MLVNEDTVARLSPWPLTAYVRTNFLTDRATGALVSITMGDNGYTSMEYVVSTPDNVVVYGPTLYGHHRVDTINVRNTVAMWQSHHYWYLCDERGRLYIMPDLSGPKIHQSIPVPVAIVDINTNFYGYPIFLGRDGQMYVMINNILVMYRAEKIVGIPSSFPSIVLFSKSVSVGYGVDGAAHYINHRSNTYYANHPEYVTIKSSHIGIKLNGQVLIEPVRIDTPLPVIRTWSLYVMTIDGKLCAIRLSDGKLVSDSVYAKAIGVPVNESLSDAIFIR